MNTSKMRRLEELSVNQTFTMFTQSEDLKNIATQFFESMDSVLSHNQIVDVLKDYDLGTVTAVYEIYGGYVNRSFGIYTEKEGKQNEYFVRKYKYGVKESEIVFEHLMIDYSKTHGLDIVAGVIRTKDGSSYVKRSEGVDGNQTDIFFAVYEFLEGEDLYTWDTPNLTDGETASAAGVLASFHNAAKDFDPKGLKRVEPKIMDFLPTLHEKYIGLAQKDIDTKFHKYYNSKLKAILEMIDKSQIPQEIVNKMPYTPCHSDFHAGNLKYKDDKVVGLFDFDWSKIDLRLFDVCLALAYCCSSWQDEKDGDLLLDKCSIFLKAYQSKLVELGGLEPLNALELEWLPTMMAAANIYLINWDVLAYYAGKNLNEYEYIAYLQHNIRLMIWIENHKAEIAELGKSL
ncbi:putative homoserine kinase type II (protein kinase fold) [Desulfosporosinus orientis DSM 765]|uniref:Putative homoserine kinase type II (Protein kinase fold) n=1 Tax=Desulfosporosinus orientis (strain ATCC 19365 / DSM 765 / NCIMB 8382 / VKM B-1628 / Singapore I) TaxID=768706 RepID=G7WEW2_DESOD|nr:phosphotransferase [Desulfosporosinus orientis]AET67291.1 putative homoserine kinase type II (protein kinase fold) [Desulfosporosinus orientis DSM 765]